jgi:hypothetical protein
MSRENEAHPVVAFVAGDLEQRTLRLGHRLLDRPAPGKDTWILNRRSIGQGVGVGAGETLDDSQILIAQSAQESDTEAALVVELEVLRFDDERVAVPAAACARKLR